MKQLPALLALVLTMIRVKSVVVKRLKQSNLQLKKAKLTL
jgi:ABC-type uncharacterized transport system permease subunit